MDHFIHFVRRVSTSFCALGTIALTVMVAVVMANIVLRLFDSPIMGTYEAVELLSVIIVSFSLSYCAVKGGHVFVTMIISLFPQRIQTIFSIITTALSIGIWGLIVWHGGVFAKKQTINGEATAVMNWPIYPFRFVFVLGGIILCLVLLGHLIKKSRELIEK